MGPPSHSMRGGPVEVMGDENQTPDGPAQTSPVPARIGPLPAASSVSGPPEPSKVKTPATAVPTTTTAKATRTYRRCRARRFASAISRSIENGKRLSASSIAPVSLAPASRSNHEVHELAGDDDR